jgi:hypothetical protein
MPIHASHPHLILAAGRAITTDGYLSIANSLPRCIYSKRDHLFFPGIWRGRYQPARLWSSPLTSRTLVVGHSDYYMSRWHSHMFRLRGVSHIFAVNADPIPGFVTPLPLGLTNDCNDTPVHSLYGNQSALLEAWAAQPERRSFDGSIYANFSVSTCPRTRASLVRQMIKIPTLVHEVPQPTYASRLHYLRRLRELNFVLCPEGNGVDTVRIYETLLMGGFPIVKRHRALLSALTGLPICWVDDWTLRDFPNFLKQQWSRLTSAVWDYQRLDLTFWRNQFAIAADTLNSR